MNHPGSRRLRGAMPGLILASTLLATLPAARALDRPQPLGEYAHTSWASRDGYSLGAVFAMAQTPDGYLWLASETGLVRFDGEKFVPWQPPAGKRLPNNPYSLLVSRDGTLWIGTYYGLASWNGVEFSVYPELRHRLRDVPARGPRRHRVGRSRQGRQRRALRGPPRTSAVPRARRRVRTFVWSLAEDELGSPVGGRGYGALALETGTSPAIRVARSCRRPAHLSQGVAGRHPGRRAAALRRTINSRPIPFKARTIPPSGSRTPSSGPTSCSRDRDGGIWIGTDGVGLHHVKDGKAETFSVATGLSGDIACSLFEDREGNIWFASEKGLDRFRKLSVATLWVKKGPCE